MEKKHLDFMLDHLMKTTYCRMFTFSRYRYACYGGLQFMEEYNKAKTKF